MRGDGSAGRITLVNSKHPAIDGEPGYPDATSLPATADLAVGVYAVGHGAGRHHRPPNSPPSPAGSPSSEAITIGILGWAPA